MLLEIKRSRASRLRVAASDAGLSLSDPGNLHPKRKSNSPRNKSGGNCSQHPQPGSGVYRRRSDASGNRWVRYAKASEGVFRFQNPSEAKVSIFSRGSLPNGKLSSHFHCRDSMRSPLPPHLKYQHQVHKCSWSDAGSVSSRSSTDLLSSPGPSRAGQGKLHFIEVWCSRDERFLDSHGE